MDVMLDHFLLENDVIMLENEEYGALTFNSKIEASITKMNQDGNVKQRNDRKKLKLNGLESKMLKGNLKFHTHKKKRKF